MKHTLLTLAFTLAASSPIVSSSPLSPELSVAGVQAGPDGAIDPVIEAVGIITSLLTGLFAEADCSRRYPELSIDECFERLQGSQQEQEQPQEQQQQQTQTQQQPQQAQPAQAGKDDGKDDDEYQWWVHTPLSGPVPKAWTEAKEAQTSRRRLVRRENGVYHEDSLGGAHHPEHQKVKPSPDVFVESIDIVAWHLADVLHDIFNAPKGFRRRS